MSKLKVQSVAVAKESRYLNVLKAPGARGYKREYYRVLAATSQGQMMLKVLFPTAERALHVSLLVHEKGSINTNHWEK